MVKLLSTLVAWSAIGLTASAQAGLIWDFSVCNGSTFAAGTAYGTVTGGGAVGNAYACAAKGSTTRNLSVTAWGSISTSNNTFGSAFVSNQGTNGFGVGSPSEGGAGVTGNSAALDNDPTSLVPNLILLTFSTAVILDQVTLGWSLSDADITVMAYTGAGAPSSFLAGKTSGNLTAGGAGAGWSLVQNAGDAAPDTAYAASNTQIDYGTNGAGVSSAYWLIGAYNLGFGGGTLDSLVDYSTLLAVSTRDAAPVPEPATLALVGAGLIGLLTLRRSPPPMPSVA